MKAVKIKTQTIATLIDRNDIISHISLAKQLEVSTAKTLDTAKDNSLHSLLDFPLLNERLNFTLMWVLLPQ